MLFDPWRRWGWKYSQGLGQWIFCHSLPSLRLLSGSRRHGRGALGLGRGCPCSDVLPLLYIRYDHLVPLNHGRIPFMYLYYGRLAAVELPQFHVFSPNRASCTAREGRFRDNVWILLGSGG